MPSIEGPELEALYVHAVRAGWTVERCKRDKGAMDLMTTLVVVVAVICAGAVVTFIGARLIERAHRPRGQFIDVGGFRQHVIELGHAADPKNLPVVLLHGAAANLQDMNLALGVTGSSSSTGLVSAMAIAKRRRANLPPISPVSCASC